MTTQTRARPQWLAPAGLLVLSFVPVVAGAFRMAELTGGAAVTAENARFFASPVPIVGHIVGATTFLVLGAFQFVPTLRRRAWHRVAGRIVLPCGLIGALSALWMTIFYPLPPADGTLLDIFRLIFGTGMVVSLVLAFLAIRKRDVATHRAWMMRGYAIGLGAGSQAVSYGIGAAVMGGTPGVTGKALLLGVAWVLNLVVAEVIIHRERS
jgi:uncharacterized membrane protein